jgi:hypothetical protein
MYYINNQETTNQKTTMKKFITKKSMIQTLVNAINLEVKCPNLPLPFHNDSHKKVAHDAISSVVFEVEQFLKEFGSEDLAKGFASKCLKDS